jgi:hypothetical protein
VGSEALRPPSTLALHNNELIIKYDHEPTMEGSVQHSQSATLDLKVRQDHFECVLADELRAASQPECADFRDRRVAYHHQWCRYHHHER